MAKIYISSTYEDLREQRRTAHDAVLTMEHQPVGMEHYTASDERPLDRCLKDVSDCQGYIGIIARRYGFVPPGYDKSITQLEYERATELGIPRLIFVLAPTVPWEARWEQPDPRLDAFRAHLMNEHMVRSFSDAGNLAIEVTKALAKAFGAGRRIPDLLPYLCNRSDQEHELQQGLDRLAACEQPLPFITLIHGDEYQGQEELSNRLAQYTLPRLLELPEDGPGLRAVHLQWPSRARGSADLHSRLRGFLGEEILRRRADDAAINAALAANPGPVMIHTHLLTEDCQSQGIGILADFVDYWRRWPDLHTGQRLLVFAFLKYQVKRNLGWFRRRRFNALNEQIAQTIEELGGIVDPALLVTALPRLQCVHRSDVENWARRPETAQFISGADMMADIRGLYESWEREQRDGCIPMEDLGKQLRQILHKFNRPQEGYA